MATKYDSEGFVSTPLEGQGARRKYSYFLASEEDEAQFKAADSEYRRLKADFARIARTRRQQNRSKSESSRSPSPVGRQPLHQIMDDDERYSLTSAALYGEVASDVRDVFLQPFLTHKYESLKGIPIERRGLTTPERVNKLISVEKIGSGIPSRFLRRLQKTAGFGTKAVNGKAVIRQAFIRQMPTSIRAHLATQPDSASLESLAMLADRALASENDINESKPGVAEIQVSETGKLVGLLEDLSRRLKKLETATATEKRRNSGRARTTNNRAPGAQFVPNVQAKPFVPNRQGYFTNINEDSRTNIPPPNTQQNNATQPIDTANVPVCYYHHTFGDKARTCRDPCAFSLNC